MGTEKILAAAAAAAAVVVVVVVGHTSVVAISSDSADFVFLLEAPPPIADGRTSQAASPWGANPCLWPVVTFFAFSRGKGFYVKWAYIYLKPGLND